MLTDPFTRLGLDRDILSVSQLNQRARHLLEDVFTQVWVEGELSNLARPSSGHIYFTLKDSQAQIRCALFKNNAAKVRNILRDGLAVRVCGRVSIYEGRGDYQMILERLEAAGDGALRLAFEALKTKLDAEGLFAQNHKKVLPSHPQRIGIITSPSGAVIRDMISVFARRAPQVELVLIASPVQGKEATPQLVKALELADNAGFDALILARGGGSLEDLWCFNEEAIARAIFACKTPIVSAIGHETDVSISDFVADVRAPTPSAAAELLAPDMSHLARQLEMLQSRLERCTRRWLFNQQQRLDYLRSRLRHPKERLDQQAQRLDDLELRLKRSMQQHLQHNKHSLAHLNSQLQAYHPKRLLPAYHANVQQLDQRLNSALSRVIAHKQQMLAAKVQTLQAFSPLNTLSRGYSILLDAQGKSVQDAHTVTVGQRLTAHLAKGSIAVEVCTTDESPSQAQLFNE
ncbi:exodeoxyribonuclease VII large subunit [Pseudomonas sp. F1_0610]|uniref:exodeoxyribonuclease VII large subunit n=1 Tax=Pseudomonas sp. F1_0610 TaxID=3114284 RepID=UPI0039C4DE24